MNTSNMAPPPLKAAPIRLVMQKLVTGCTPIAQVGCWASILGLTLGCGSLSDLSRTGAADTRRELDFTLQIDSVGNGGTYRVSGITNLPDDMTLTIAAVRQLDPTDPAVASTDANRPYSILDYQSATVVDGQWQSTLTLWQVAPDGSYQESWQRQEALADLKVSPSANVQFLATLAAPGELEAVTQSLDQAGLTFPITMLRTLADGKPYLQLEETLAIALPTTQTTPPALPATNPTDDWGDRSLTVADPSGANPLAAMGERPPDAPAKLSEYLR